MELLVISTLNRMGDHEPHGEPWTTWENMDRMGDLGPHDKARGLRSACRRHAQMRDWMWWAASHSQLVRSSTSVYVHEYRTD